MVLTVQINGIVDPTRVSAELSFDETGKIVPLEWEPVRPEHGHSVVARSSGQDCSRGDHGCIQPTLLERAPGRAHTQTDLRPKNFVLVDRFIGGDDDRIDWKEGFENLSRAGFSAVMAPPNLPMKELLHQAGVNHTGWAVYSPPGYAFSTPLPGAKAPESPSVWATKQAKPYLDNGFAPQDIAVFAMSDEPGWYYPAQYGMLQDAEAAQRFRDYLQSNNLDPRDLGIFQLGFGFATWPQCRDRFAQQTAILLDSTLLLVGFVELLCPLYARFGERLLPRHSNFDKLEFLRGTNVRARASGE